MSSWTLFFVPITNRWSRVLRCALCAPLTPASSLRCAAVINRSVRGDLFHQPILWVLISSLDHREHNRSNEQSTDHTIFLQQYLQHSHIGTCGIFCLRSCKDHMLPQILYGIIQSLQESISDNSNAFYVQSQWGPFGWLRSYACFFNNEYKDLVCISKSLALTLSVQKKHATTVVCQIKLFTFDQVFSE
jgi:hypothetical protein